MTGKTVLTGGRRSILAALILSTTMTCTLSGSGWAMLAPAQSAPAAEGLAYGRASDVKAVQTALESKIVRDRLQSLGLNDKEIEPRLSKLSDRQVHQQANVLLRQGRYAEAAAAIDKAEAETPADNAPVRGQLLETRKNIALARQAAAGADPAAPLAELSLVRSGK